MGRVLEDFRHIHSIAPVPALTLVPVDSKAAEFYARIGFVHFQPKVLDSTMLLPATDILSAASE
jgi:hypothetical protein